jgi:Cys-tRNA(Pro)/Cys-tRNA(Cys) deacylase
MPIKTPATCALDRLALPYHLFIHAGQPISLEDAARQRGQESCQVIRSILFRHEQEYFVMVLIAGPGQISWKRVRAHLGVSRISMATTSEVRKVTGYEIGTVNPLGLPQPIRILADESVFQPEEISIGSGVRGTAILLSSAHLLQALEGVEVGNFSQP